MTIFCRNIFSKLLIEQEPTDGMRLPYSRGSDTMIKSYDGGMRDLG